jgi:hypothetical protein
LKRKPESSRTGNFLRPGAKKAVPINHLHRKFPESELGNKSTEQGVNSAKLGIKSSQREFQKNDRNAPDEPKITGSPKPDDRAERRVKSESSSGQYHALLSRRCGFVKLNPAVGQIAGWFEDRSGGFDGHEHDSLNALAAPGG